MDNKFEIIVKYNGQEILNQSFKNCSINRIPQYDIGYQNWGQASSFKVEPNSEKTIIELS